jgi:hypothetical protein
MGHARAAYTTSPRHDATSGTPELPSITTNRTCSVEASAPKHPKCVFMHKVQTATTRVGSVWPALTVSRHLMPLWILSSSLARRLLLLLSVSLTSKPCWEHALGCPGGTWRPGAAANALPVTLIITTSRVRDTHFVASGGARRRTRRQRTAAATHRSRSSQAVPPLMRTHSSTTNRAATHRCRSSQAVSP